MNAFTRRYILLHVILSYVYRGEGVLFFSLDNRDDLRDDIRSRIQAARGTTDPISFLQVAREDWFRSASEQCQQSREAGRSIGLVVVRLFHTTVPEVFSSPIVLQSEGLRTVEIPVLLV